MKYTTSPLADEKIEQDTKIIVKKILENWKENVVSVVMFGGFGHGGGSFKKLGKKILPLNDYDLYIISKKPISGEELEKVGAKCSHALGRGGLEIVENASERYDENKFFHVDLHNLTLGKMKHLYPTQRTADLKTSIVVYGDKNILNQIPDLKISKSDAIRMLFNKLDHFAIAQGNSRIIKQIYSVKGFTDLCSALLVFYDKYVSTYQERVKIFQDLEVPAELKRLVKQATEAKLNKGYYVVNVNDFFEKSQKWVLWALKKILKEHLKIQGDDWVEICKQTYKKLPYVYFNDYLGGGLFFPAQYYLNWKFFREGLRKKEFLPRSLFRWRDAGLIVAIALILWSVNEKKEAEKYLKKLASKTQPLKERILHIYSVYYLQKLV